MKPEPDKDECEDQDENTAAKSLIDEIIEETESPVSNPPSEAPHPKDNLPTNPAIYARTERPLSP